MLGIVRQARHHHVLLLLLLLLLYMAGGYLAYSIGHTTVLCMCTRYCVLLITEAIDT